MKLRNTTALVCASLAVFLTVSSCKDSPTSASAVTSEEIFGKWIMQEMSVKGSVTYHGISIDMDTTITFENDLSYLHFHSDYTYVFRMDGSSVEGLVKRPVLLKMLQVTTDTGAWSLSGDTLSLNPLESDTATTMQVKRDGQFMLFTMSSTIDDEMGMSGHTTETITTRRE